MKKLSKKQKDKLKHMIALVSAIMLLLCVLVTGIFTAIQTLAHKNAKTSELGSSSTIKKPLVQEKFLTVNQNSRPGIELSTIKGIVVHYTANPGTDAVANRNYFESRKDQPDIPENKVSSHFVIGLDGTIIQCIPLDEIAYASNKRNVDTISIECCHPDKSGIFTKNTYDSLVDLVSWLCQKYQISKKNLIRHYDVTGKKCPKYYVNHPKEWKKFKKEVYQRMN